MPAHRARGRSAARAGAQGRHRVEGVEAAGAAVGDLDREVAH